MIKKLNDRIDFIIAILFISPFFLWSLHYGTENVGRYIRFLFLLSIIFILFKFKKNSLNLNFILVPLLSLFLLYLHLFTTSLVYNFNTSNYNIFSICLFCIFIFTSLHLQNFFRANLEKIIIYFYLLFFLSTIINLYDFKYDNPFYCGGLKDFFYILDKNAFNNPDALFPLNISFQESIFFENSHLGMIAPAVILYSYNKFVVSKKKIHLFLTTLFYIICLIKSSTTLHVGIILCAIGLLLFNFKNIKFKVKITYFLLIIISSYTLYSDKQCNKRFIPIYEDLNVLTGEIYLPEDKTAKERSEMSNPGSLSGAVHFTSFLVAKDSLLEKPFGHGFNQYKIAFNNYFTKNTNSLFDRNESSKLVLKDLNDSDASNNFAKILVEFGIFGLIIFIVLFLAFISQKIDFEVKIFLFSIVITQLVRGAGYFNGGFALSLILIFVIYFSDAKFEKTK